jgi:hypothetical protein
MKVDLYEPCGSGICKCKACVAGVDGRLRCRDCGVDRGQLDEHGLVRQGSSVQRPIRIRAY